MIFRARFAMPGAPRFAAGPESQEVALFRWPRVPRGDSAFPSVNPARDAWRRIGASLLGVPAGNPVRDPRALERFAPPLSGTILR